MYIIAVTKLAATCEFGETKDDCIRDRLVHGIRNQRIRQKLFETLDACVKILRDSEVNQYRTQQMSAEVDGAVAHQISTRPARLPRRRRVKGARSKQTHRSRSITLS